MMISYTLQLGSHMQVIFEISFLFLQDGLLTQYVFLHRVTERSEICQQGNFLAVSLNYCNIFCCVHCGSSNMSIIKVLVLVVFSLFLCNLNYVSFDVGVFNFLPAKKKLLIFQNLFLTGVFVFSRLHSYQAGLS